jgi:arylsulfatase A-like enzyme
VDRPSNVLLVLTDDQGVDKVGSYDAHPEPPPTPVIDALAARGVSFDRAYAYPSCSPSRGALLTGKLGHRTGLGEVIQYADDEELPIDTYSLPRMLEASPWAWETGAYGKWHIASFASQNHIEHPLLLGFGAFAGSMANLQDPWLDPGVRHGFTYWDKIEDGQIHIETTYATTDTVDDALEAMDTLKEPWLIYVPFNAPHTPLHEPPEGLADPVETVTSANLYDAAIQALDTELGRLLSAVDPSDTLVIFASDNGTSSWGARAPTSPDRVKLTPYEGGIRVPLIVAGPGVVEGARSDALVHLVDILPTVAEVAQVDLAATGEVFDGESLWPYLVDPARPGREVQHGDRFAPNGRGGEGLVTDWWVSHGPRFKVVAFGAGAAYAIVDLLDDPNEDAPYLSVEAVPPEDRAEAQALVDAQRTFFEGIPIPTW